MDLTIITVTYNDLSRLQATVTNVLQFIKNSGIAAEILVVDGASSDGTAEWLQAKQQEDAPQVLRFISEADAGIYDAMNKGIAAAQGKWLWFVNAGDCIYGNPCAAIAWHSDMPIQLVSLQDNGTRKQPKGKWYGMPYCHQGILFQAALGKRYDTRYKISADYDYLLQHIIPAAVDPRALPLVQRGDAYIEADVSGLNRQQKWKRDRESLAISLKHFGICQNILFFIALFGYRVFERPIYHLKRRKAAA